MCRGASSSVTKLDIPNPAPLLFVPFELALYYRLPADFATDPQLLGIAAQSMSLRERKDIAISQALAADNGDDQIVELSCKRTNRVVCALVGERPAKPP